MVMDSSPYIILVLTFFIIYDGQADKISRVTVKHSRSFPIELGDSIRWTFIPSGGAEYDAEASISFTLNGLKVFRVQRTKCSGSSEKYFACEYHTQNEISVTFTPDATHYDKELIVSYLKDSNAVWTGHGDELIKEKVQLIKAPSYIRMDMRRLRTPQFPHHLPAGLRLEPPVFLTDTSINVRCTTDGALPPTQLKFKVECPPPPTAVVENARVTQASSRLMTFEEHYSSFGFRSAPTLVELAPLIGRMHAKELQQRGHISTDDDNKTLNARLYLTGIAHDCHVICRMAGKETRERLTVYHPTTVSYLLPRLRERKMQVGSSLTCYADGHPPPTITLRLTYPLHTLPYSKEELRILREKKIIPKHPSMDLVSYEFHLRNHNVDPERLAVSDLDDDGDDVSFSDLVRAEQNKNQPGDGLPLPALYGADSRTTVGLVNADQRYRVGKMHPSEYTIDGATFRLAPNATPGAELLLICEARNVLPGDSHFLGLNGTVAKERFTVVAVSYTGIGISLGVCGAVLLVLLIIVGAMLMQKRRPNGRLQDGGARMNANGTKRPQGYIREPYNKDTRYPAPTSRIGPPTAVSLLSQSPGMTAIERSTPTHSVFAVCPSPQAAPRDMATAFVSEDPAYTSGYAGTIDGRMIRDSSFDNHMSTGSPQHAPIDSEQLQYVQLSFDQPGGGRTIGRRSIDQNVPTSYPLRGGVVSSSTLYRTNPSTFTRGHHSRPHLVSSVPQGLNIDRVGPSVVPNPISATVDESSHYTEIVGYMQPKAHASQLVLQQQQEATQALLAMQQSKPKVFV